MDAYFCATPLHIFTSIILKKRVNGMSEADIYILNQITGCEKIAANLETERLFRKVILVDNITFKNEIKKIRDGKFKRILLGIKYICYKKISKNVMKINHKEKYARVYLGIYDILFIMALRTLSGWHRKLQVVLFEDGIGSYITKRFTTDRKMEYLFKVLGFNKVIKFNNLYLNHPKLYGDRTDKTIAELPQIQYSDEDLLLSINKIFSYTSEHCIKEKIIFFEQPYNEMNKILENKIPEFLEYIAKHCEAKDNLIVKLHPRSSSDKFNEYNTYISKGMPWEVIDLNNLTENNILISYFSTACFTSKLIFDKEPYIIMLYDMKEYQNEVSLKQELQGFVNVFKECYRDPTKILIPGNLDELCQYICEILAKEI